MLERRYAGYPDALDRLCCIGERARISNALAVQPTAQPIHKRGAGRAETDGETVLSIDAPQRNMPVAIYEAPNECGLKTSRNVGPINSKALARRQSKPNEPSGCIGRAKDDAVSLTLIFWPHAIRLLDHVGYVLDQFSVLRAYLDGVAIYTAVAPDDPERPRHTVRPAIKRFDIKGIAEYRLCQPGLSLTSVLRTAAHGLSVRYTRYRHACILAALSQRCHLSYDAPRKRAERLQRQAEGTETLFRMVDKR